MDFQIIEGDVILRDEAGNPVFARAVRLDETGRMAVFLESATGPIQVTVANTSLATTVSGTVNANITNSPLATSVSGTVNTNITNSTLATTVSNTVSTNIAGITGQLPRTQEEVSYAVSAVGVTLGNNKSLLSIHNAQNGTIVRVHSVWLLNVQTTAITGVVATFELRRLVGTAPTGGTNLSTTGVEELDTNDPTPPLSGITMRTGGTVVGESTKLLRRVVWSTDEYVVGTLDTEGFEHASQAQTPLWGKGFTTKPIVLRTGQGLTVKCATSTTIGQWDVFALIGVE
jgi:hypothetical protein